MKTIGVGLLLALALLLPSSTATAGVITIGDFSGSETVIDFESLGSAPATGPFSIGSVTFSESSSGTGGPGWRLLSNIEGFVGNFLTDNAGISLIQLDFAAPQLRAGVLVGVTTATYSVSIYDSSLALLESTSVFVSGAPLFAGFENAAGISRMVISETSGENGRVGGLDDVRFEGAAIPEPGTWALFGIGLLALTAVKRARKRG